MASFAVTSPIHTTDLIPIPVGRRRGTNVRSDLIWLKEVTEILKPDAAGKADWIDKGGLRPKRDSDVAAQPHTVA